MPKPTKGRPWLRGAPLCCLPPRLSPTSAVSPPVTATQQSWGRIKTWGGGAELAKVETQPINRLLMKPEGLQVHSRRGCWAPSVALATMAGRAGGHAAQVPAEGRGREAVGLCLAKAGGGMEGAPGRGPAGPLRPALKAGPAYPWGLTQRVAGGDSTWKPALGPRQEACTTPGWAVVLKAGAGRSGAGQKQAARCVPGIFQTALSLGCFPFRDTDGFRIVPHKATKPAAKLCLCTPTSQTAFHVEVEPTSVIRSRVTSCFGRWVTVAQTIAALGPGRVQAIKSAF